MINKELWEMSHSSLSLVKDDCTYYDVKNYSLRNIVGHLTRVKNKNDLVLLNDFKFICRVSDSLESEYKYLNEVNYARFSTITSNNVSRNKNKIIFIYDILPSDIVHIFPLSTPINDKSNESDNVSLVPSLWLKYQDLAKIRNKLQTYDEIICKTKRNNQVLKPFAILDFNIFNKNNYDLARYYNLLYLLGKTTNKYIEYIGDILNDYEKLSLIEPIMSKKYDIDVRKFYRH